MDPFNCDFNAPMFVDFEQEDVDGSNPESYFDIDHEAHAELNAQEELITCEEPRAEEENLKLSVEQNTEEKDAYEDTEESLSSSEGRQAKITYGNLVASWGNNEPVRRNGSSNQQPLATRVETPTRKALRKAVAETVAAVTNSPKLALPERAKPKRLGTNLGAQPRLGVGKNEAKPEMAVGGAARQAPPPSPAISRWRRAVSQMTPEILRNAREARQQKKNAAVSGTNTSSSNDDVNKTVSVVTKKFKDHLKANRILAGVSQASKTTNLPIKVAPLPVAKPLHPTNPQPFKFATDSRIKPTDQPKSSESSVDFLKMLRTYKPNASTSSSSSCLTSGPTQVKPFSFSQTTTSNRRARSVEPSPARFHTGGAASKFSTSGAGSKFMSTAEMMRKFQNSTPDRFHSQPRGRSSSAGMGGNGNRRRSPSPKLTRALSPKLLTRGRTRPQYVLGREQLEELEIKEAKKNQFKAHGVNEGVTEFKPVVAEKKKPTIPEPFHLTELPKKQLSTDEPKSEFHARPAPRKMFEGPLGIPERRPAAPVEPQSPAFMLRDRLASRRRQALDGEAQKSEEESRERVMKARPAPHFGVPVMLPSTSKVTTVEPFSFYDRDAAMIEKKQKKIEAILEEEKKLRQFKANPVPDLHKPVNLPLKEVAMPTRPEPFELQIEKRVGERLQKWQEDISKELEQQREAAKFYARPASILEKQPFIPKPSDKPLSEVSNFELHSDRRAREREQFDQQQKQKEAEIEGMKRQLEDKRRQDEEREMLRLRREAVHKAQPVKHYRPVEVLPSDKPLTTAQSPKFSTLTREKKSSSNDTRSTTSSENNVNMDQTFDM